MGSKLSVVSTSSCRLATTTDANRNNITRVPNYLKPTKLSKKHQHEQRQRQELQAIGVAVPYQPDSGDQVTICQANNASPKPPFVFSHSSLEMLQQEQLSPKELTTATRTSTTSQHNGPKNAFQWFEGRRYQNQGASILPNDERELDRLRVLNYILRWALEGDVVAPVKTKLLEGAHVLSVGCGPGIWLGHPVIDFALDYNKSHFTAVDVLDLLPQQDIYQAYDNGSAASNGESYFNFSPLHPMLPISISCSTWHQQHHPPPVGPTNDSSIGSTASTPSFSVSSHSSSSSSSSSSSRSSNRPPTRSLFDNLDIYALDIREQVLPFADNSFECVMQRLCTPAYSIRQWGDVVNELIRVTQPGGYIQFVEVDYNAHGLGPYGQAWQDTLCSMLDKTRNLDPFMASHIDTVLIEHGLVNVEKKKISIPLGRWGLDIGILWQQNLEAFIEASAPAFGSALGISAAECIAGWQKYKDELNYVKAFVNVYAVWGQKPEECTT